jgi:hypothetical protein
MVNDSINIKLSSRKVLGTFPVAVYEGERSWWENYEEKKTNQNLFVEQYHLALKVG